MRWDPFLRCTDAFLILFLFSFVSYIYFYLSIFAVMFYLLIYFYLFIFYLSPIYLLSFNSSCPVNVVAFIVAWTALTVVSLP